MRWVGVITSLIIVGFGLFCIFFSVILINRSSNTGLMAFGAFWVLVGLGLALWMISRARRRNRRAGSLND